jgi:SAM-dependent methyltransferase
MTNTQDTGFADWSVVADGWDAHRERVESAKADLTKLMLDALRLRPGQHALELGAGTGEFARLLSVAVGPHGRVLATDAAAGMVDLIGTTNADLPNVETAQVDAASTGLPDRNFDAVAFRMGLMFVPAPDVAVREIHRVLRPGGRLAAATWAAPEHNPWLVCVGMSAMLSGLISGGLPTESGGPLSLGDPTALGQLATDAGFVDVDVQQVPMTMQFRDVDEHLRHVTSLAPPLAIAFRNADDDKRAAMRATLEQVTEQYRTEDGLALPGLALLLTAKA